MVERLVVYSVAQKVGQLEAESEENYGESQDQRRSLHGFCQGPQEGAAGELQRLPFQD